MFNWSAFTLFLYIVMRMSGCVMFSPIFGRSGIPGMAQAGFTLMLSVAVYGYHAQPVTVPDTLLEFLLRLLVELFIGFTLAMIMRFFYYIPDQAGEIVDTQMGMSMAKTYDPSTQSQMTNTANLLNALMMLIFFSCNGHVTLLRIMTASGEIVPFGEAALNEDISSWMLQLFAECAVLAVKLALPILAAELLGQVGMGVLMKVIPQINVFVINIELKVIVGLVMLLALIAPMGDFLLQAENAMLDRMQDILTFFNG